MIPGIDSIQNQHYGPSTPVVSPYGYADGGLLPQRVVGPDRKDTSQQGNLNNRDQQRPSTGQGKGTSGAGQQGANAYAYLLPEGARLPTLKELLLQQQATKAGSPGNQSQTGPGIQAQASPFGSAQSSRAQAGQPPAQPPAGPINSAYTADAKAPPPPPQGSQPPPPGPPSSPPPSSAPSQQGQPPAEDVEYTPFEENGGNTGSEEDTEKAFDQTGERSNELTEEEQRQVEKLKERDREVRAHEAAHIAAGGPYVSGGANYTFQTGPDGKQYAIGGEVSIDTSPENSPQKTIEKAQTIRAAALAPAEPSSQDLSVASQANQMEAKARAELAQENIEEAEDNGNSSQTSESGTKEAEKQDGPALEGAAETTKTAANEATDISEQEIWAATAGDSIPAEAVASIADDIEPREGTFTPVEEALERVMANDLLPEDEEEAASQINRAFNNEEFVPGGILSPDRNDPYAEEDDPAASSPYANYQNIFGRQQTEGTAGNTGSEPQTPERSHSYLSRIYTTDILTKSPEGERYLNIVA